jgi:hypothetical protein
VFLNSGKIRLGGSCFVLTCPLGAGWAAGAVSGRVGECVGEVFDGVAVLLDVGVSVGVSLGVCLTLERPRSDLKERLAIDSSITCFGGS